MKIDNEEQIELLVENKSANNLVRSDIALGRNKHIETIFHFFSDRGTKATPLLLTARQMTKWQMY